MSKYQLNIVCLELVLAHFSFINHLLYCFSCIYIYLLQASHILLEEIREINQRLIDTVVVISDEVVDPSALAAAADGSEGTIVKCSFSAVALSPSLKSQYTSAQMVGILLTYRVFHCLHKLSVFLHMHYYYAVSNSASTVACSYKLSELFPNTFRQVSC